MHVIQTIIQTLSNLRRQRSFLDTHIKPILISAERSNDGSLGETDFRKIERYYGWAVPAVLGEAFCAWHGRRMTPRERWCSTCMGAMTGLFDDFFDKDFLDDASIRLLMDPNALEGKASNEKLFRFFFKTALDKAPDKSLVQSTLATVYQAQVASKLQSGGSLTDTAIRQITREKGGTSLLFYRTAWNPPVSGEEKELLYDLGGLMQVSNDIFDIYKDKEAGIRTLATTACHIEPLRDWFRQELDKAFSRSFAITAHPSHGRRFLSLLCLGIFCRVFVCLDQLESLEKRSGGTFMLREYSRQDLICDMDTWANKWVSGRYFRELMKGIKT